MYSKLTSNIMISVVPVYDVKNSFPSENKYVFTYYITIMNLGDFRVKLLKRQWHIYDVGYGIYNVHGDGVIGLNPIIDTGAEFTYFSNVTLHSGVGTMQGKYLFENMETGETLEAEIPKFELYSLVLSN